MVKDIELQKRIDEFEKEVNILIALDKFMRNSSYFIEKRKRQGANNES